MNSSIKIDQAVKQYENVLKHRGSGELIIAAFTALSKWLRYESEFKNIETWRKARHICWSLMKKPQSYNLNHESLELANDAGIQLANMYHETGELEKKYTFRFFVKNLGITSKLNSNETGDLILCLLILNVVVENCENQILIDKYNSDIESICKSQLEGDKIYNETLNYAKEIYLSFSSEFQD